MRLSIPGSEKNSVLNEILIANPRALEEGRRIAVSKIREESYEDIFKVHSALIVSVG